MKEGAFEGEYHFIYFTPEILLSSKKWLLGDLYSSRLLYFIIEGDHTVVKWLVSVQYEVD